MNSLLCFWWLKISLGDQLENAIETLYNGYIERKGNKRMNDKVQYWIDTAQYDLDKFYSRLFAS